MNIQGDLVPHKMKHKSSKLYHRPYFVRKLLIYLPYLPLKSSEFTFTVLVYLYTLSSLPQV